MVDKNDYINKPHFILKFAEVGIAPGSIISAAATAQGLSTQAKPLNPGALAPCNQSDYQQLFIELAKRTAT
jgi:hypothetical protein